MEKTNSFFRYLAYTVEIILLFVLETTPNFLPEFFNAKPCFLLALAISISVYEREIPSMIFGLVCGLLLDYSYCGTVGTFTFALTIICFILGYCANNIISVNFFGVVLCSLVVISLVLFLQFVFSYLLPIGTNAWLFFKNNYISRIFLTFIFAPVFYFLNKFIYSRLSSAGN